MCIFSLETLAISKTLVLNWKNKRQRNKKSGCPGPWAGHQGPGPPPWAPRDPTGPRPGPRDPPKTLYLVPVRLVSRDLRAKSPDPRGDPPSNKLIDPHRACWHTMRFSWGAVILELCRVFSCCDFLQWRERRPGVSGRNSLPLTGTPGQRWLLVSALFMPLDFCIEFCIDFRVDFGPYFGPKFVYFSKMFWINFQAPFLEWLLMCFCHLVVPLMS